jgi:hypothetical protein
VEALFFGWCESGITPMGYLIFARKSDTYIVDIQPGMGENAGAPGGGPRLLRPKE